jgi:hypothetical protein
LLAVGERPIKALGIKRKNVEEDEPVQTVAEAAAAVLDTTAAAVVPTKKAKKANARRSTSPSKKAEPMQTDEKLSAIDILLQSSDVAPTFNWGEAISLF